MRYWSSVPHADEDRTRESLRSIIAEVERGEALQWALERKDDGRVIGSITLMLEQGQPRAELGYILGREHWGQGYAAEAQRRTVAYAFDDLGLHRLEADTHPDNAASTRSLERLGLPPRGPPARALAGRRPVQRLGALGAAGGGLAAAAEWPNRSRC